MGSKTVAPWSAADKSRPFNGSFEQVGLRSRSIFLKNCNGMKCGFTITILETKHNQSNWQPRGGNGPIRAKLERSRGKVMVTGFGDTQSILLVDFLGSQITVTSAYYESAFRKLVEALTTKNAWESFIRDSCSTTTMLLLMLLVKCGQFCDKMQISLGHFPINSS